MSGSPRDLVREYFPKASDDEARDVLWGCTGWPNFFDTRDGRSIPEILREQLSEIAEKSGGDPFIACCMAVQEMDQAMERGKREREERVRLVAYLLWEKECRTMISEEETLRFWLRAEEMTD